MPKRLAITVSGAVSLGSYEAGVMYEVIRALGQHNDAAIKDGKPENQILIDVMTGASAGALTATIAAQKLMFEADALNGAYSNSLYGPWVTSADIKQLLTPHAGDNSNFSILSSGFFVELSRRYITDRYASHLDLPREKHSAIADKLWLGLSLSNLNGVDYGLDILPAGTFIYTRFQDQLTTLIENLPSDDSEDYWDALRNAAVSSGAFPYAFSPVNVVRGASEYQSPNPFFKLPPSQKFCYTDGGTFQNEPLGLAKNLVDLIDPTHIGTVDRYYLFVAPGGKNSVSNLNFNAASASFLPFTFRIVSAIFNQARFQDWITAETMNSSIDIFNARAAGLAALLNGATPEITARAMALQGAAASLLPELFKNATPLTPGGNPIREARDRLKIQFATEYQSLPAATRDIWIDSILVLEQAAELGERDEMKILGITATDAELAGADLCAFGGFFDVSYRKHDYDVGRTKARKFLTDPACPLGNINFTPEEIDPVDSDLNNLKLEDMDEDVRQDVYDRFKSRILEVLQAAGLNLLERTAVYDFVIASKLKALLKLS